MRAVRRDAIRSDRLCAFSCISTATRRTMGQGFECECRRDYCRRPTFLDTSNANALLFCSTTSYDLNVSAAKSITNNEPTTTVDEQQEEEVVGGGGTTPRSTAACCDAV